VWPVLLNYSSLKALVEICCQDRRNAALVEDLGERDISPRWKDINGIDKPLKKIATVALHSKQVVDGLGVEVRSAGFLLVLRLRSQPKWRASRRWAVAGSLRHQL
jgi:hypothetical protein